MKKKLIFIFFILIKQQECLKINIFKKNRCHHNLKIKKNSSLDFNSLKKNDNIDIYIEGEKCFKTKVVDIYNIQDHSKDKKKGEIYTTNEKHTQINDITEEINI